MVERTPGVIDIFQRNPVGRVIVTAHPRRIDRIQHLARDLWRLQRHQLMTFQAEENPRLFRRALALFQRFDQLYLGLFGVIIGMGKPGAIGVHGAGTGVDAAHPHPTRQP